MNVRDPYYVIGHKNPDTDSIASAIGYAWLLREHDNLDAVAARAGALNAQSKFALGHFQVESPLLLEDAAPRFAAIAQHITPLQPNSPLHQAWQQYADLDHPVPIVDTNGLPQGLVTGSSVFGYLSKHLNIAESPFRALIDVPCIQACDPNVPVFNANDRVSDLVDNLLRVRRDYFWVVDADGKYVGICRRADMIKPPKIKVILVDHNEVSQAVNGLEQAELMEVLDHHRIGAISTTMPIAFHVDVVGSCSTLVAERMRMATLIPPPGIAGLLLSGLLSDTLIFKSPTSTLRDQSAANWLARIAFGASGSADAEAKLRRYGEELLMAGADLTGRSTRDLVSSDYKEFEAGRIKFGIAQIEVTSFSTVMSPEQLAKIREALAAQREQHSLEFAGLMVTDIVQNNSLLVLSNEPRQLAQLPFSRRAPGLFEMPGVVSRKKQLLPTLLGLLNG